MIHKDHKVFVNAIHTKQKLIVKFYSKEDGQQLTRTCAPFDHAVSRRAKDNTPRYHFWDYDSDEGMHTLGLLADQIMKMEITDETFDPATIITWDTSKSPWTLPRDWGRFS